MARTVSEGFATFFQRLTPLESQRTAAARHRQSVEGAMKAALTVNRFMQPGSFSHGTGVRNYCDVDLLVSIGGGRPNSSDTALRWVKDALVAKFPHTPVHVSRPAVVVDFAGGTERWEVVPAFLTGRGGSKVLVYDIPGPSSGWIDTAPDEHIAYANECNEVQKVRGGAKKLARLGKAWKYYNNVPISSFYLEMRAAEHVRKEPNFIPVWDLALYLGDLNDHQLAAMKDPKDVVGRFNPCSSAATKSEALKKLSIAASRARKALDADHNGKADEAFGYLNLLFNGNFPAR